jgi:hypothetical protein
MSLWYVFWDDQANWYCQIDSSGCLVRQRLNDELVCVSSVFFIFAVISKHFIYSI